MKITFSLDIPRMVNGINTVEEKALDQFLDNIPSEIVKLVIFRYPSQTDTTVNDRIWRNTDHA